MTLLDSAKELVESIHAINDEKLAFLMRDQMLPILRDSLGNSAVENLYYYKEAVQQINDTLARWESYRGESDG